MVAGGITSSLARTGHREGEDDRREQDADKSTQHSQSTPLPWFRRRG